MSIPRPLLVLSLLLAVPLALAAEPPVTIKSMTAQGLTECDSGKSPWTLTIELAEPLPVTVHLKVETIAGGTATPNSDYEPFAQVYEFKPGDVVGQSTHSIRCDLVHEGNETILIRATQEGVERGMLTATIVDNDAIPKIDFRGGSKLERDDGPKYTIGFEAELSATSSSQVQMTYTTVDGTAVGGEDYVAASGKITILPGQKKGWISVRVIGDTQVESDETFVVRLSNPVGAIFARNSADGVIKNDDFPSPPFVISPESIVEGNSGSRRMDFNVTLETANTSPTTVTLQSTGNGSAVPGVDFEPLSETLMFAPGLTQLPAKVMILGDTNPERDETFELAVVEDGVVRTTTLMKIVDDDDATNPVISIADTHVTEGHAITSAAFQVTLSTPAVHTVSVRYETSPRTASQQDYVHASGELVFFPGESSKTIPVSIQGDRRSEETETFALQLLNATGATIGDANAVCTIIDDDASKRRPARH